MSVADRAERVNGKHAEEPLRHRLRDVKGEVPAPRMADDVRLLPTERVEDAAGIDIRRHRVRPSAADGSCPRCWYHATSFSSASSSARSRR